MKFNNIIIEEQKRIAIDVLKKLGSNNIKAIVAGGAPRNWEFKNPANDIDVFIESSEDILQYNIEDIFNIKPKERENLFGTSIFENERFKDVVNKELYKNLKHVNGVFDAEIDGQKIQFILFNSVSKNKNEFRNKVFDSFDFGLCKIAYLISSSFVETFLSDEFMEDFENKKLTASIDKMLIYNNVRSLPRRAAKLKELYPEFELVIK